MQCQTTDASGTSALREACGARWSTAICPGLAEPGDGQMVATADDDIASFA